MNTAKKPPVLPLKAPASNAPTDASATVSPEDLEVSLRVLETLVNDPKTLASLPEASRRALVMAAGRLSRPTRHERVRITKALRRYRKKSERKADEATRMHTGIRESRIPGSEGLSSLLGHQPTASVDPERELNRPRTCYVCKEPFTKLHFFYDAMCPPCAELNYQKRSQTAPLKGRLALITGARIKIGYQAALMLLRAGTTVIATTRFPHDAAKRYAQEQDHALWKDRLTLYGLDLRHFPSVEIFSEHVAATTSRLDILINNAAQTVQRPAAFFDHLRPTEQSSLQALPEVQQGWLENHHRLRQSVKAFAGSGFESNAAWQRFTQNKQLTTSELTSPPNAGVTSPLASASPLALQNSEELNTLSFFPPGELDVEGQQLDLRRNNSWRFKLEDVGTPELVEVHLVNSIAPFILCRQMKELMRRTPNQDKHIVNVSAMEGCFSRRTKTENHPHTNMAKAALNMLTRTSAQDYLKDGIHMNSVDTGWITDEDPFHHARRKRDDLDFHPPLDSIDGAARVCDPIFTGYASGEHPAGLFFKDYAPTGW